MKIINYKKTKSNIYEITLSNKESVVLYDDIILKYELLLKKDIDKKLLEEIKIENDKILVYYESLKYLTTKMRTEKEIRNKFKDYPKIALDYAIERLKKEKYLNNELYIKAYVNDMINLKFNGPNKIKNNLNKLGFNDEEIYHYLNTISNNIWLEKINKIIAKEKSINKKYSGTMLKNKIVKKLYDLGYYSEHINEEISNYEFIDNNDIYNKEKEKAIKKYSKKFSGIELEMKVNNYLYQKGFKKNQ